MARAESQPGSQAQGMTEKAKEAGTQAMRKADEMTSMPMRAGEQAPSKAYMAAVVGSILASLGLFLAGRTAAGIFVGLWAPTILNLGLFNKLLQPSQESLMRGEQGQGRMGGTTTEAGRAL
ncbi:MAG TPA: hypothetical protein VIM86_12330 [Thermodesulfobacteriota bacterium]